MSYNTEPRTLSDDLARSESGGCQACPEPGSSRATRSAPQTDFPARHFLIFFCSGSLRLLPLGGIFFYPPRSPPLVALEVGVVQPRATHVDMWIPYNIRFFDSRAAKGPYPMLSAPKPTKFFFKYVS